jgi:hypothetical protein
MRGFHASCHRNRTVRSRSFYSQIPLFEQRLVTIGWNFIIQQRIIPWRSGGGAALEVLKADPAKVLEFQQAAMANNADLTRTLRRRSERPHATSSCIKWVLAIGVRT